MWAANRDRTIMADRRAQFDEIEKIVDDALHGRMT
jgi:hypothetical protein